MLLIKSAAAQDYFIYNQLIKALNEASRRG